VVEALAQAGVRVPLVVGGIIPDADVAELLAGGVAAVYTPKDFELATIVGDIVALVDPGDGAR
jgi:(2R)-ethylmalonyl-CoA mutase